jgi:hypothetical protein
VLIEAPMVSPPTTTNVRRATPSSAVAHSATTDADPPQPNFWISWPALLSLVGAVGGAAGQGLAQSPQAAVTAWRTEKLAWSTSEPSGAKAAERTLPAPAGGAPDCRFGRLALGGVRHSITPPEASLVPKNAPAEDSSSM